MAARPNAPIVHPKLAQASFGASIRALLETPESFRRAGVQLVNYRFPFLDVDLDWHQQSRWIRLRVFAQDFNYRPIGGWWIDANGNPLVRGSRQVPANSGFHTGNRPDGQPGCWLCFPGWAEWHDHNGHHKELSWAGLRADSSKTPLALIQQLVSDLNKPGVGLE